MEPMTIEAVRTAISQTADLGPWVLFLGDSTTLFGPAFMSLPVAFVLLILAGPGWAAADWALRAAGAGLLGFTIATTWVAFQPLDAAFLAPARVVLQADAILRGETTWEDSPSNMELLAARRRVSEALRDADLVLKKLCLAEGQLCSADKQSLATAQLRLATSRRQDAFSEAETPAGSTPTATVR